MVCLTYIFNFVIKFESSYKSSWKNFESWNSIDLNRNGFGLFTKIFNIRNSTEKGSIYGRGTKKLI